MPCRILGNSRPVFCREKSVRKSLASKLEAHFSLNSWILGCNENPVKHLQWQDRSVTYNFFYHSFGVERIAIDSFVMRSKCLVNYANYR